MIEKPFIDLTNKELMAFIKKNNDLSSIQYDGEAW